MMELFDAPVAGRRLRVVASERVDGDVHPHRVDADVLTRRQEALTGRRWTMLDQVHGTVVVEVGSTTPTAGVHAVGDVQWTDASDVHVAMWAADCAVVVLADATGRLVAAHAGWRGLADGVLDVAVGALDAPVAAAVLGPVVHPCCYEFGGDDRALVEHAVRAAPGALVGTTSAGAEALDVPAAVAAGLARHGVRLDVVGPCTGCDERWFSHRVRAEPARHATIAWMESIEPGAPSEAGW